MIKYLLVTVLALIASYGLWKAAPLLAGPSLQIASPTDQMGFPDGNVTIRGRAARATQLTLNGDPLLRDEEGSFSTTLTFPQGGSILTLVATDRFGRTVSKVRSIFVP